MKFFTPLLAIFLSYYPNSYSIYGIVSKVYDGDTIEINRGNGHSERIRLVYIDAAEMEQGIWAKKAKARLEELIDKKVRVEVVGKGYYGRTLGEVFYKGKSYNFLLLKAALVWIYPWSKFQSFRQKNNYLRIEAKNKQLKRGIWKNKHQNPWKYRKIKRGV